MEQDQMKMATKSTKRQMDETVFLYVSNVIIVTKLNANRKPTEKEARQKKINNTENENNNNNTRVVTIDWKRENE